MWNSVLMPSRYNAVLWTNALFLLLLLIFNLADPLTVVFAYFMETIIIGIIHLIKLAMVSKYGRKSTNQELQFTGIPLMLFFAAH